MGPKQVIQVRVDLGVMGSGSNGNEGVLRTPYSSRTGASPSDAA